MATGGEVKKPVISLRSKAFKELTVTELPPRNFELVRAYKGDMKNSGLDPNIFKRAIVNSLVKIQFALLAFAACGKWQDENEIYNIGCDFVALLREIDNAFHKLSLSTEKVLECSRSAYHYAEDGESDLAQEYLGVVAQEMKKLYGQFPESLLTRMEDILEKMKTLQYQYVKRRQEMQEGLGPKIETMKKTLEEERQKKDKEFEEKKKEMNAEIEKLRSKWFNKEEHEKSATKKERERLQSETEQQESNDEFQKDIASLDLKPDEMVRRDPTGRALHGAIDAFRALTAYLGWLRALLNSLQSYYESAGVKPVVGLNYRGDLRSLIRRDSSRIDIITSYCRWMALEDLFRECFTQVHTYHDKFCEELKANPTQAEAHHKLKDENWIAENARLLRSLEQPDRFTDEPADDYGPALPGAVIDHPNPTEVADEHDQDEGGNISFDDHNPKTVRFTDGPADDYGPALPEAVIDNPNPMQVEDEHDQDEGGNISFDDHNPRINRYDDPGQRIPDHQDEGAGDNQPPREPRQPDSPDVPQPPSPVLLSAFILFLLAAVFIQWLFSNIG